MKRFLKLRTLLILVLLLALVGLGTALWQSKKAKADSYLTSAVSRGSLKYKVSATGTLQAVITVQVGSQVSGRIQNLYADFNSVVKQGQLLARIDPANFEAARDKAAAELATVESAIRSAEATIANKQAELISSKANAEAALVALSDAQRLLKRSQELATSGLIADRELEATQATVAQAEARYSQAKAQINQIEAQLRSAKAQYEQAKAQAEEARASLRMAEVNLKYTIITSPIDGVVIERNVDIGQTVAASLQAPTLFVIAQDLTHMQLLANVDEADIGMISENTKVDFTVDAFPGEKFRGRIEEIRLNAKTVQNVVTYNVVIGVENPQLKLRPGMTANITMTVAQANDVLQVPNAALRYRPSNVKPGDVQKLVESSSPDTDGNPPPAGGPSTADRRAEWRNRMAQMDAKAKKNFSAANPEGAHDGTGKASRKMKSTVSVSMEPGEKVHFQDASVGRESWQVIWVLDENKQPQPRRVKLGITDGTETAVLEGDIKEGDVVIVGENISPDRPAQGGIARSPFQGSGMKPKKIK